MAVSAEVSQFYDRLIAPPVAAWNTIYQTLVDGLVTDGIWSGLDGLFLLATSDAVYSLTDLTSKASVAHVFISGGSAPIFAPKSGWTSTSNLVVLQTGFKPLSNGVNFTRNDNAVFVYVHDSQSSVTGAPFYELVATGAFTEDYTCYLSYILYAATSGALVNIGTALSPETGLFIAQRTASGADALYRETVSKGSSGNSSVVLVDSEIAMRGSGNVISVIGYGKSFDATKRTALTTRINTAMTAIGALP